MPASDGDVEEEDKSKEQPAPSEQLLNSTPVASVVATHTPAIGIIHPPPDIRAIVDKTAQFVARNGPDFENRILIENTGKPRFSFLRKLDPYHSYYRRRISEFQAAQRTTPSQPPPDCKEEATKPDPSALFKPHVGREPPEDEQYTIRLPEGITSEEVDIIKLTAQFVTRTGKSFLTGLASREMNNPLFHFLKPTHSMFMFFTAVVDSYSKVLMPAKGSMDRLRKSVADMTTVHDRCLHRLEWELSQEQARQKAEDEVEQERVQMAMIDWHDFVVVETIEFADDEDGELPHPMTLEEVIRRPKMSAVEEEVFEPVKDVEMEMEEDDQLVQEGMRAASLDENDNDNKKEPKPSMRIVKNWKRPEERIPAEIDPTKVVISPITGEKIPINEMAEHMRISLIDPKYKEQKERMMAKIRETTLLITQPR